MMTNDRENEYFIYFIMQTTNNSSVFSFCVARRVNGIRENDRENIDEGKTENIKNMKCQFDTTFIKSGFTNSKYNFFYTSHR